MNALRRKLTRRRFGYVASPTIIVAFVGATGTLNFEGTPIRSGQGFAGYGNTLWRTAIFFAGQGAGNASVEVAGQCSIGWLHAEAAQLRAEIGSCGRR